MQCLMVAINDSFIRDTTRTPKPCQRFLKGRFVCILQPKPRNGTFVIESGGALL